MKTIKFTSREQQALLHRLTLWDCIHDVFSDTEGLEHLAEAAVERSQTLVIELEKSSTVTVDESSELDRELLIEAIEGNTWVAIHHPDNDGNNTLQGQVAAYRTLCHIADKVSLAFDVLVSDIDIPTY